MVFSNMVVKICFLFVKHWTQFTLKCIREFNAMNTSFVSFEYERIANILSTFLALYPFVNKFFVISQFDQSPVSMIVLITFVRCTSFMFHSDMFSVILLHFKHFVTVRAFVSFSVFVLCACKKVIPKTSFIDF